MSFITMVQPIIQCCFLETPHSQIMRQIIGINMCPAGIPPPEPGAPGWDTEGGYDWRTESGGRWLLDASAPVLPRWATEGGFDWLTQTDGNWLLEQ